MSKVKIKMTPRLAALRKNGTWLDPVVIKKAIRCPNCGKYGEYDCGELMTLIESDEELSKAKKILVGCTYCDHVWSVTKHELESNDCPCRVVRVI